MSKPRRLPQDGRALGTDRQPQSATGTTAAVATLVLLSLAYGMSIIDRMVLNLLVDPIKLTFGLSDAQMGLLQGFAFLLIYSIAGLPLGWLADRWDRPKLIAIAMSVWSVMTAACGVATGFWALFACRAGVGTAEAGLSPSAVSLISQTFPLRRLAAALSIFALGGALGSGLALLAGGALFGALSANGGIDIPGLGHLEAWQGTFVIISAPGLLLAAAIFTLRDPRSTTKTQARATEPAPWRATLVSHFRDRLTPLVGLHVGAACVICGQMALLSWGPSVLVRTYGWTIQRTGLIVGAVILTTSMLGLIGGGLLSDHLAKRGAPGRVSPCIWGSGTSLLGVITFSLAPSPSAAIGGLAVTLLFTMMAGGASMAAVQSITPAQLRGFATAVLVMATGISSATAPMAVGLLNDHVFHRPEGVNLSILSYSAPVLLLGWIAFIVAARHPSMKVPVHVP